MWFVVDSDGGLGCVEFIVEMVVLRLGELSDLHCVMRLFHIERQICVGFLFCDVTLVQVCVVFVQN
jgi:hypothetical protein